MQEQAYEAYFKRLQHFSCALESHETQLKAKLEELTVMVATEGKGCFLPISNKSAAPL